MKVELNQNPRGEWQADIFVHDGWDAHAVGPTPGMALMELGAYIEANMPKPDTDLQVLGKLMVGGTPSSTKPGNVR